MRHSEAGRRYHAGWIPHHIINLLDPLGKAFYKTVLDMHPDFPAPFQYGYSARRAEGCHLAAHDCVAETT